MIDFSRANSLKPFARQVDVGEDVATQIERGQKSIAGVMIESDLVEGRQDVKEGETLAYGKSITDACLGWQATEELLYRLAKAVEIKNS